MYFIVPSALCPEIKEGDAYVHVNYSVYSEQKEKKHPCFLSILFLALKPLSAVRTLLLCCQFYSTQHTLSSNSACKTE